MTVEEAASLYRDAMAEKAAAMRAGDAAGHLVASVRVDAAEAAAIDGPGEATSLQRMAELLAALG